MNQIALRSLFADLATMGMLQATDAVGQMKQAFVDERQLD
jgi:hypothetical protein